MKRRLKLTRADLINSPRERAIREVIQSLTPEKVHDLIEWSIEIAAAAKAKGCPDGKSIPDWIREAIVDRVQ